MSEKHTQGRAVKERPILFSGAMVRALLAGTKTQTRRAIKAPDSVTAFKHFDGARWDRMQGAQRGDTIKCPYGYTGDRLWVREAWAKTQPIQLPWPQTMVVYREGDNRTDYGGPWKPSIHMPRAASRITLEVTGVRVERLQDISAADALAEGITLHPDHHGKPRDSLYGPVRTYADLWESINGPESWAANPWVWVVEFKRVEAA